MQIMQEWEEIDDVETGAEDLEDITELLFEEGVSQLKGLQMLCEPGLELFDTMNSFEVMDPKMDCRMHRKDAMSLQTAKEKGILLETAAMSPEHKHAFV